MTFADAISECGLIAILRGITPANMQGWVDAGVAGFGIGSNIYKQGATAAAVANSAKEFITAWRALKS